MPYSVVFIDGVTDDVDYIYAFCRINREPDHRGASRPDKVKSCYTRIPKSDPTVSEIYYNDVDNIWEAVHVP